MFHSKTVGNPNSIRYIIFQAAPVRPELKLLNVNFINKIHIKKNIIPVSFLKLSRLMIKTTEIVIIFKKINTFVVKCVSNTLRFS